MQAGNRERVTATRGRSPTRAWPQPNIRAPRQRRTRRAAAMVERSIAAFAALRAISLGETCLGCIVVALVSLFGLLDPA